MQGYIENISSLIGLIQQAESMQGEVGTVQYCIGSISGVIPTNTYTGQYNITPKAYNEQVLETANKLLLEDVIVKKVPYYETSNLYDGKTVYIAEE